MGEIKRVFLLNLFLNRNFSEFKFKLNTNNTIIMIYVYIFFSIFTVSEVFVEKKKRKIYFKIK